MEPGPSRRSWFMNFLIHWTSAKSTLCQPHVEKEKLGSFWHCLKTVWYPQPWVWVAIFALYIDQKNSIFANRKICCQAVWFNSSFCTFFSKLELDGITNQTQVRWLGTSTPFMWHLVLNVFNLRYSGEVKTEHDTLELYGMTRKRVRVDLNPRFWMICASLKSYTLKSENVLSNQGLVAIKFNLNWNVCKTYFYVCKNPFCGQSFENTKCIVFVQLHLFPL